MISSTSAPVRSIPPGSPFCSGCNIKSNCPNIDTGPEEPILEQYRGFYTGTSTIGNFTLNDFAQTTAQRFLEMGYASETIAGAFVRLQDEIRSVILMEA